MNNKHSYKYTANLKLRLLKGNNAQKCDTTLGD